MQEYVSNSHKSKQKILEKKEIQKVVTGPVKTKKKNEITNAISLIFSEAAGDVLTDVLIPAVKKAISDIITNGTDMMLYGETGRTKKSSMASKISYRSYYDDRSPKREYRDPITRGRSFDLDIIIETRGEADEVLMRMDELIATYGMVSVADYHELVGISGNYTDNKYGWTDIRNASIVRVRDGFKIKLPRPYPLDD